MLQVLHKALTDAGWGSHFESYRKLVQEIQKIEAKVEKELRSPPKEFETYAQPHERLAEALGKGLAELAKRKPVVILLDTFEIVDRPECDYTLRTVIRCGGNRVVWAIAGRSNLADSGRRGKEYFRGYKADFPEERIYAKSMSEFGVSDIQEYFQAIVPDRLQSY